MIRGGGAISSRKPRRTLATAGAVPASGRAPSSRVSRPATVLPPGPARGRPGMLAERPRTERADTFKNSWNLTRNKLKADVT
jgi:hypothetical protein